jgi:hypothetical protein
VINDEQVVAAEDAALTQARANLVAAFDPREVLAQTAGVAGIEVLDQHEREAGIGRHRAQQAGERVEPARGGADADDREIVPCRGIHRPVTGIRTVLPRLLVHHPSPIGAPILRGHRRRTP